MDNVNKPKWESCINRREFAICTEKTCHSIGDFPPPRRPPFHQKALPAIPPTELGDTNLLLRVLEYCTAVTFFPKAQCATTACGFQHPSFGRSIAKKRYPCTWIRRLTFILPVKTLAELFAAMVTGEGGLNIQTEWPIMVSVCFQYIGWGFSAWKWG